MDGLQEIAEGKRREKIKVSLRAVSFANSVKEIPSRTSIRSLTAFFVNDLPLIGRQDRFETESSGSDSRGARSGELSFLSLSSLLDDISTQTKAPLTLTGTFQVEKVRLLKEKRAQAAVEEERREERLLADVSLVLSFFSPPSPFLYPRLSPTTDRLISSDIGSPSAHVTNNTRLASSLFVDLGR